MVSLLMSLFYLSMGLSGIFEKRRKFSGGLSEKHAAEPVFVNLLRSLGIDFEPVGPVRQPYLYRPARATWARGIDSSESDPGLHERLQIRALVSNPLEKDRGENGNFLPSYAAKVKYQVIIPCFWLNWTGGKEKNWVFR